MTDETKNVMYRCWREHFDNTSLPNTTHPAKNGSSNLWVSRTIGRPRRSIHHPETAKAELRFLGVTPAFPGESLAWFLTSLHVPRNHWDLPMDLLDSVGKNAGVDIGTQKPPLLLA